MDSIRFPVTVNATDFLAEEIDTLNPRLGPELVQQLLGDEAVDQLREETGGSSVDELLSSVLGSTDSGARRTAISPAAIILMLRQRLDNLDSQIDSRLAAIDQATRDSEWTTQQMEAMQAIRESMSNMDSDPEKALSLGEIEVTWQGRTMTAADLMNEMRIGDFETGGREESTLSELLESRREANKTKKHMRKRFRWVQSGRARRKENRLEGDIKDYQLALNDGDFKGHQTVTGASIDTFIQRLQSRARRENSGTERLMIDMQSCMSTRGQAITLATQMLEAISEGEKRIAGNIG